MTGHWRVKAKRVKAQREAVRWACATHLAGWMLAAGVRDSYAITLTRIAPKKLDSDNLQGSFKAVRDEVAALLGIDDGSEALSWRYLQRKGSKPYEYAVEIEVEAVGAVAEAAP